MSVTWKRLVLLLLGLIVLLLAAGTIAVFTLDWNRFKPYAEEQLGSVLGRSVTIEGAFGIDPGLTTRVSLERPRIANASWAEQPWLARADKLTIDINVPALLTGRIVISRVVLDAPRVRLETSEQGDHNWILSEKASSGEMTVPEIQSFTITNGQVTYRDARRGINKRLTIDNAEGATRGSGSNARLQASGTLAKISYNVHLDMESDSVRSRFTLGKSRLRVNGTLTRPFELEGIDLDIIAEGPGAQTLAAALPVTVPALRQDYKFTAHIKRAADGWSVNKFSAHLGESALEGEMTLDTTGGQPRLKAVLRNAVIVLRPWLAALPDAAPGQATRQPRPWDDLRVLRTVDADIRVRDGVVRGRTLSLQDLEARVSLQDGKLSVQPFTFTVVGGRIEARTFRLEAREPPVKAVLDIDIKALNLSRILREFGVKREGFGAIDSRIELTASGKSLSGMLGSADGSAALIMQQGRLDQLLVQLVKQDVTQVLTAMAGSDKATVKLRCLIADFDVAEGIMKTTHLILDTVDAKILGQGRIDLGKQAVDLTLQPRAKDFSLFSSRSPVHITGNFSDLSVGVDQSALVASLLSPVELGVADDAECREMARAARAH